MNMPKTKTISILFLSATILVGCSNKPPSCTDEKSTELVKRIFFKSLTCQLKYVDSNGNSQSAICTDTKGCQSWAEGPKGFMPLIGAKADLVIGKKYIPEGGVTMDNVVGISLADADPPSSSK